MRRRFPRGPRFRFVSDMAQPFCANRTPAPIAWYLFALLLLLGAPVGEVKAQVPSLLNYQGRLLVRGGNFDGPGQFKMALVSTTGSNVYWRNAPDTNADGEPDTAVSLPVSKGIYAVALGDTTLTNMSPVPASVFTNNAVFLRVWFNDGTNGFQRLVPDQRITAVGYAMMASTVTDGAITQDKLAPDLAAQIGALNVSADAQDATLVARGYRVFMNVPAPSWSNGATTDAPTARTGHTAVWTGQELLVWGGDLGQGIPTATGGSYAPLSDQWRAISQLNPPTARSGHTAVWTGTEMIVWGGAVVGGFASGGGRYDPAIQNWSSLTVTAAPSGRQNHVSAWTGSRMIVWGGANASGLLSDGALFDPVANQWTTLTATNPPSARRSATAVWTGTRFIVWGGQGSLASLNTGAQLVFTSGTGASGWTNLNLTGAPSARYGHTAIWTGQKMIVWGGRNDTDLLGDGAAYDPITDTWSALASTNAPVARENHVAIWTGSEMIIFGGANNADALASGAAYDPAANKWRSLSNPGSPVARSKATAVWSGTEILVFGGDANGQPVAALQKVNPQPAWYLFRKP